MAAQVQVKCVACKHVEWVPLGIVMPMCSKCFSPTYAIGTRA